MCGQTDRQTACLSLNDNILIYLYFCDNISHDFCLNLHAEKSQTWLLQPFNVYHNHNIIYGLLSGYCNHDYGNMANT